MGRARAVYQTIGSFGGGYDDGNGKLKLNTPENVAAVAWLREMVQKGYVPEIAFAGGFQEEQAFMDCLGGRHPHRALRLPLHQSPHRAQRQEVREEDPGRHAGRDYGRRRLPGAHACAARQEARV